MCEAYCIGVPTFRHRYYKKQWGLEEALITPLIKSKNKKKKMEKEVENLDDNSTEILICMDKKSVTINCKQNKENRWYRCLDQRKDFQDD